jgi:hypothetical protein
LAESASTKVDGFEPFAWYVWAACTYVPGDVTDQSQWEVIMVGTLILLAAVLAVGFASSSAHAEVRIGAAAALTGTNSWFGEQHERVSRWPWPTSTRRAACSANRSS